MCTVNRKLGLSKLEVRKIFRTGNKLVSESVVDEICPLGAINDSLSKFRRWLEVQHPAIENYFYDLQVSEFNIAWNKYTRPCIRGNSGELYSAMDMDNAMMYNN